MKTLLIGGAGFVGSSLSSTIKSSSKADIRLEGSEYCDITDPKSLASHFSSQCKVVLLAAEHKDDVHPVANYYKTNVDGTRNVLRAMDTIGCKHLIFTSSVAVYGLNKDNPDENHDVDPFNHYGKSKWEAEKLIKAWYEKDPRGKSVTIIRPTVIFGENNRGNVYNLLRQIINRQFLMIGRGNNSKSMCYIGNVVEFIKYRLDLAEEGYQVFNYVDKPDLTMNSLVRIVRTRYNKKIPSFHVPIWIGYAVAYIVEIVALVTRKKYPISVVRVKKFIATTKFDASKLKSSGFVAPYSLEEGIERTLLFEFGESEKISPAIREQKS